MSKNDMGPPVSGKPPVRWGVVATALESPDLLAAFASHHAVMGASRIHLYLDAPSPRAEKILAAIPAVEITICDDAYWKAAGVNRPNGQENRQIANANHAYRRTDVEWLAHIDADEFLWMRRDLAQELAHVPNDIDFLQFEMRERVYTADQSPETVFSGGYRMPFNRRRRAARAVFGPMSEFAEKGFSGHLAGKSILRTGNDNILAGIHVPRYKKAGLDRMMNLVSSSTVLAHFDGLTPAHWVAKMLRYMGDPRYARGNLIGEHRERQLRFIRAEGTVQERALEMHDMLKQLDPQDEARLRALGLFEDAAGFDPMFALKVFGLTDAVDLSVAASDSYYGLSGVMAGRRVA